MHNALEIFALSQCMKQHLEIQLLHLSLELC